MFKADEIEGFVAELAKKGQLRLILVPEMLLLTMAIFNRAMVEPGVLRAEWWRRLDNGRTMSYNI